jgi:hypothetical protein
MSHGTTEGRLDVDTLKSAACLLLIILVILSSSCTGESTATGSWCIVSLSLLDTNGRDTDQNRTLPASSSRIDPSAQQHH